MDAIVEYFEQLVTKFTWRRLVFLLVAMLVLVTGWWAYERYTGQSQSNRMKFAAEQLKSLSDPELKKNVQGNAELEKVHHQLKVDLGHFVDQSGTDTGIPAL